VGGNAVGKLGPVNMKTYLSSSLTFIYKIVLPTIWTLIVFGLTGWILLDSHDPWTLLMLLLVLPMLSFIKLNRVSYDDQQVYIFNGRSQQTYELKQIKSMNEGNIGGLDPFFELEINSIEGEVRKVDFLPKMSEQMRYVFTGQLSGRLLEFKNKIRRVKSDTN
jgi:hypothetical protein